MNLRKKSLQEGGYNRGLSPYLIQEEFKDEPCQFKGHEDMKIMAWNTIKK